MIKTEDLMENGLHILVDKPAFSYGSDAVALANFTRLKKRERALDLGAGTGILSILLQRRHNARLTAIEINEALCKQLRASVLLNGQEKDIEVLCDDLRTLKPHPGFEAFDAAVCNPPYFNGGTQSENEQRMQSRHQDDCTLRDVAACAARLLKAGGCFYLCCPVSLFADCCAALVEHGMQPKRVCIQNNRLALIQAKKGGGVGMQLIWETV